MTIDALVGLEYSNHLNSVVYTMYTTINTLFDG